MNSVTKNKGGLGYYIKVPPHERRDVFWRTSDTLLLVCDLSFVNCIRLYYAMLNYCVAVVYRPTTSINVLYSIHQLIITFVTYFFIITSVT